MSIALPDASMTTASKLVVTQPDVESLREPLLALWARNLPGASPERFDWLYGSGRSQAWLLQEQDGGVIGSAGWTQRRMAIAGQIAEAGVAIDLNVDEQKRSLGPALALVREVAASAERDGMSLTYAIPIRPAVSVMKLARYRSIGELSNWTKVLRTEFKLRHLLRSRWAARLAAPFADVAWRLFDPARRTPLPANVAVESVSTFDERFDRLWLSTIHRFAVIGERTADFLTWRFLQCPEYGHQIFTLVNRESHELLGYVVWHVSDDAVSIADLLAVDNATTTLLLAEFNRMVRETRATAIRLSCFASSEFYQTLQAAGFSRRADGLPVLVKTSGDNSAAMTDAQHGHNWYLTMADHDVDE